MSERGGDVGMGIVLSTISLVMGTAVAIMGMLKNDLILGILATILLVSSGNLMLSTLILYHLECGKGGRR